MAMPVKISGTGRRRECYEMTVLRTAGSAVWAPRGLACAISVVALSACTDERLSPAPPRAAAWAPGTTLPSAREVAPRGMLDLRGLIHAHSVYSHDACDGEPWDETTGAIDEACFGDFRRDICRVAHDFVMLTDHGDRFSWTEFPDVLLHRPDRGDRLVERAAQPVANWLRCDDGVSPDGAHGDVLVLAGNESAMMPVGLEGHVAETEEARDAIYGTVDATNVAALQAQGAVVLAQHTEDWEPEQLVALGLDGFEMYNLHANTIAGAGGVIELISLLAKGQEIPASDRPHPDLVFLNIVNEDERYLSRWGEVLAGGHQLVTTIGTDCHRNTFPQLLDDGERIDSYRRMMSWMSNHLLVRPEADGGWDDRHLKEALASRRLYGAFEVMGFPEGFDFHAESTAGITEMGDVVTVDGQTHLVAKMPQIRDLDPTVEPPAKTLVLHRAVSGGWEQIAQSTEDLDHPVSVSGAYRVEVRLEPRHLRDALGTFAELADRSFVWIYSNAIFVK